MIKLRYVIRVPRAAVIKRNAEGKVSNVASYNPRKAPLDAMGTTAAKNAMAL